MLKRAFAASCLALALASGSTVLAAPTAPVVIPAAAEPVQFYVFSFTETPVAEAAQDIVGSALGYDLTIDPATEGVVTFSANGLYSGPALLQDFGSALLDQDIALMRTGQGAYAVVPRANIPTLMARGGVLMTLPTPTTSIGPARIAAAETAPVPVYGRTRWWDGALGALLVFFAGAIAGGAALFGGQTVYRRAEAQARLPSPLLRLTDQTNLTTQPVDATDGDPDLVIPRFTTRSDV